MAKFVAAKAVERIEWDFTGVPHVGAQDDDRVPKTVQGDHVTGVLPEPDPDTVARFVEAHEQLVEDSLRANRATMQRYSLAHDADAEPADVAEEVLGSHDAILGQYAQAVEALRILDVPADLLEQLPPRYLSAFLLYVVGQLTGEGDAA